MVPEDPFDDFYRYREEISLDGNSITDADARSLTSSQVDRICDAVDTGLATSTFSPGFQVSPAPVCAAPTTIRIDLSRLAVVILFLQADGSPKGLSITCEQDRVRTVGDCRAEPGCVRVRHMADLKYLVYRTSRTGRVSTHPSALNPEHVCVSEIWFAAHLDGNETAMPLSSMMTFRSSSMGLSLDLGSPPQKPEEQG